MTDIRAIRIHETGGPDVMRLETIALPPPGPGQIMVRHTAVGVNFIDTYHRSGLYPTPLPSGLGLEAAGVVEAAGEGVAIKPGDRVAYGTGPLGAYSEAAIVPADRVVALPAGVADETAAAMMLKGLTVRYLLRETYPVKPGDVILFHAAAGGVGLIACQWAKALGVVMIGTAGSEEKAGLARAHGCAHVINYRTEDVAARVREITGGAGVPVVYDGVGRDTFDISLECLAPRGLMVSFGNASGPVPPVEPGLLAARGSLYLTRPTLAHYTATAEALKASAADLLAMVESGALTIEVNQRYPLEDARRAHEDLAARRTTGASVLLP